MLVEDAEIVAAMVTLFERVKTVAEPAGAAALAALLTGKIPLTPESRVVAIVSGGNVAASAVMLPDSAMASSPFPRSGIPSVKKGSPLGVTAQTPGEMRTISVTKACDGSTASMAARRPGRSSAMISIKVAVRLASESNDTVAGMSPAQYCPGRAV